MTFAIWYGVEGNYRDVTAKAWYHFWNDGFIRIPFGDAFRSSVFGDVAPYKLKQVVVVDPDGVSTVYSDSETIKFRADRTGDEPSAENTHQTIHDAIIRTPAGWDRLYDIHRRLFVSGDISAELSEQYMVARFLPSTATVLEIGANIGRNTMVIASILDDDTRLVTMETLPNIIPILEKQRSVNGFHFHIVNKALSSSTDLVQEHDNWLIRKQSPEAPLPSNQFRVPTVSWSELCLQFSPLVFDTLVLDCEGSFYHILHDFPTILDHIRLIIMENDYFEIAEKQFIDGVLSSKGFVRIYSEKGGWGPCADSFYEVWQKPEGSP